MPIACHLRDCARRGQGENKRIVKLYNMKTSRILTTVLLAAALACGAWSAWAAQSCCVQAKAKGKDCAHACCVEARKAEKLCEKCQKQPSCCDKAIAKGKTCSHPCCVDAAKDKKLCEKCNPPSKS